MLPNSSDLTYFLEVAATENLSRAAERLGISQPSLSLAIQRLESCVGVPLLIRSKKGVVLTQAGRQLLAQTRFLLQEWERVREHAVKSSKEVSGSFVIGCHPSVALYSLPLFLPALLEKYHGLDIRVQHDLSRKVTEAVISMRIDVGIVVNPVRHPDLVIRRLATDAVRLWVGPGQLGIQDPSSGNGVLICDPELIQTQDILKRLRKNGFVFQRTIASSNLEVVTQLAASGSGCAILPGRVALRTPHDKLKPLKGSPIFEDEICLVYRIENRNVRAIQTIADAISAAFKD